MNNKALIIQHGPYHFGARMAGGHRIAHYLRSEHNWDIEVLDYASVWSTEQIKAFIDSRDIKNIKWIGLSFMYVNWNSKWDDICAYIKKKNPKIKILFGASTGPNFECTDIDYYIYGYGEMAIVKLLQYEFSNGPRPVFVILDGQNRKIVDANDQYPAYPMRNLRIIYEDRDFISQHEALTTEFSRGCKFSCAFCNYPILGVKGDYTRDAEDFEIHMRDAYDRFGVTRYNVADETFNDRTEKITKFADVVEKLEFKPWFSGFIRADLLVNRPLDREELQRMRFFGHYYGIETFNRDAGKLVGKGMDPAKLQQGLLDVKKYFKNTGEGYYRGTLGLINGLPGEPVDSMLSTLEWCKNNWSDENIQVFTLELVVGDLIKASKLSANFQKYGYRERNISTQKQREKEIKYSKAVKYSEHYVNWESDLTNMEECDRITELFTKEKMTKPSWKIGNWALNNFSHLPTEEVFSLPYSAMESRLDNDGCDNNPFVQKILENYITSKLNNTS